MSATAGIVGDGNLLLLVCAGDFDTGSLVFAAKVSDEIIRIIGFTSDIEKACRHQGAAQDQCGEAGSELSPKPEGKGHPPSQFGLSQRERAVDTGSDCHCP